MRYKVSDKTEKLYGRDMFFVVDTETGKKVTKPALLGDGCVLNREIAQEVADGLNAGKTPDDILNRR